MVLDCLVISWVILTSMMVLGTDSTGKETDSLISARIEAQKQRNRENALRRYHESRDWKLPLRRLAWSMRTDEEAQLYAARLSQRRAESSETAMANFVAGLKNLKRRKGQGNKDVYLAAHNKLVTAAMYKPFIDNERAVQLADYVLNEWQPGGPRGRPSRSKGQTSSTSQQSHL
jgi:hypothetical protein